VYDVALDVGDRTARIALVPSPIEVFGRQAELDDEFAERSSGPTSPRFSCQRRIRAFSSCPMMMRASEPPMKWRRPSFDCVRMSDFMLSPNL
jgi:hypothetical protein